MRPFRVVTCVVVVSLLLLPNAASNNTVAAQGGAVIEENSEIDNVEAAFDALIDSGEWLGFRRSSDPNDKVTVAPAAGTNSDEHFQGLARSPRTGRAPVMYFTHSGDPDGLYHTTGRLLVVRFDSRDQDGERLRSNRLLKGKETDGTKPDARDMVVKVISFNSDETGYWQHLGGIQMVGDILAVPLEAQTNEAGEVIDRNEGKVVFFDCSDPEDPQLLPYFFYFDSHNAGVLGITTLEDGHFLMVVSWGDSKSLQFLRSNKTSFFDEGFAFSNYSLIEEGELTSLKDAGYWDFGKASPQTLNLLNQSDGRLYLIGARNSSSGAPFFNGEDQMYLWEVRGLVYDDPGTPDVDEGATANLALRGIRGRVQKRLSSLGVPDDGNETFGNQEANFLAASGAYVSPTGELLYYGAAYYYYPHSDESPPSDNYERLAELHVQEVTYSDTCGPQWPDGLRSRYVIAPSESLDLNGTVSYYVKPWVHMFEEPSFNSDDVGDNNVIMDFDDQGEDDYQKFTHLDGGPTNCDGHDGFNDCMSSFRWCAPPGATIKIYDDDGEDGWDEGGNTGYVACAGDGQVHEVYDVSRLTYSSAAPSSGNCIHSKDNNFNDEATAAHIWWSEPSYTYQWACTDCPGGTLTANGSQATFLATGSERSINTVQLTYGGMAHTTKVIVTSGPVTLFVDQDAPGPDPDGKSWQTAYHNLRDALGFPLLSGDQIWVAEGVYSSGWGSFPVHEDGVALYGGFQGDDSTLYLGGEIDISQRDWRTHETVLTGEDYAVVKMHGPGPSTILDGFTISGDCPGIELLGASPTLANLILANNAASRGAGVYAANSSPTLVDVTFIGNSAGDDGGGMYVDGGAPSLTNVVFSGNSAGQAGGGMYVERGTPVLTNVVFAGNSASGGGGIYSEIDYYQSESPLIRNSIFWDNEDSSGTGTASASIYTGGWTRPSISYSLVQGSGGSANWNSAVGTDGGNNIDLDPLFVRNPSDGGDGWGDDPDTEDTDEGANDDYGDLHLQRGSPAINTGNNDIVVEITTDLDGNPRISSGAVDMGPYELPNAPPEVNAGGSYSGDEGSAILLDAASATDEDGDQLTYHWDVDPAQCSFFEPDQLNPTVTCGDNGDFTVTLTVSDGFNDPVSSEGTVTVSNVAPEVIAGQDQAALEGDEVSLDPATFGDAGTLDTHTATIAWGDGTSTDPAQVDEAGGSGAVSGSHVYADDGDYTVTMCVTDDDEAETCDTFQVTVSNVAPEATVDTIRDETGKVIGVGAPVALIGLQLELAGSFHDQGTLDTHTATIDWGEATTAGVVAEAPFGPPGSTGGQNGSVVASYVYEEAGDYTVKLAVSDDDGGVGINSLEIAVMDASGALTTATDALADLLLDPDLEPTAAKAIKKAMDDLIGNNGGRGANGAVDKLAQGDLNAALVKIRAAIQYLEDAEAADASLDLTNEKSLLALSAKSVAVVAIEEAAAVATKPKDLQKIAAARLLVEEGDAMLDLHDYVSAVGKYRDAVRKVQGIA